MSTDLARLDDRQLSLIERQAKVAAKSGLVPTDNPDAAAYIMLRAAGFGLDPLTAFEHFHLIETKKGPRLIVSSAFLGGMARSKGCRIEWLATDDQAATARLRRPDQPGWTTLTYTISDAQKAGLLSKDNWRAHPAPMLRAACQRQLVRMAVPDVLLGLPAGDIDMDAEFDDEELGEDSPGPPLPGDTGPGPEPRGEDAAPGPGPSTWTPPPVDERVRAQLINHVENLPPAVAAAVRDTARNLGLPSLRGPHFTKAHGALLRRLIDEDEDEQARIDAGWPTPDEVHDDAPEASHTEEGSEHYDPADVEREGRPFA